MARYDKLFELLALRAVQQTTADLEAYVANLTESGAADDIVMGLLLSDYEEGGPLFGRFSRMLSQAATESVLAAERQGSTVGAVRYDAAVREAVTKSNRAFSQLLAIEAMDNALDDADPEALDVYERTVDTVTFRWAAELVNTCYRCLPLHGSVRTMIEWRQLGLTPETIHSGWSSSCHCQLIPEDEAEERDELVAPLLRKQVTKDELGRKTARDISQVNLDRSIVAVNKARDSEEGRAILRRMGQANRVGNEP